MKRRRGGVGVWGLGVGGGGGGDGGGEICRKWSTGGKPCQVRVKSWGTLRGSVTSCRVLARK